MRKFELLTDKELNILSDAVEEYGNRDLLGQLNEEYRIRREQNNRIKHKNSGRYIDQFLNGLGF